jgi:multiple sugar transport system permease protein
MIQFDKIKWNRIIVRAFLYFAVIMIIITVLGPYLWMVSNSFKKPLEITSSNIMVKGREPSWIPHEPTLENYRRVNITVPIFKYMINSLIISGGTMFLSMLISIFAAYALSRIKFKFKKLYELSLFSTQMFPGIAFLIPYFVLFTLITKITSIPMRDTYWGMIITYTSFALPFAILMMRNFLASIPISIDEQAQIDGCTRVQAVFRIIIPLSLPGIVSIGIYAFNLAWSEMLFASVFTGRNTRTVAIGLMDYISQQQSRWGSMMAACILTSIPVFLFFTFLQKQLIQGIVDGAVKE